jgi:hypothetical protein
MPRNFCNAHPPSCRDHERPLGWLQGSISESVPESFPKSSRKNYQKLRGIEILSPGCNSGSGT